MTNQLEKGAANPEDKTAKNSQKAVNYEDVEQRLKGYTAHKKEGQTDQGALFNNLDKTISVLPKETYEQLTNQLKPLQNKDYESTEEMIYQISTTVADYLNSRYTPEEFEKMIRQGWAEKSGFVPLNEVLSYGTHREEAHIHLAPAKHESSLKLGVLVKRGLEKLAQKIKEDPELKNIERVSATSWLVATKEGGRLMEKLGFQIDGPIDEDFRAEHFKGELRPISRSHIERDEFLAKYYRPKK